MAEIAKNPYKLEVKMDALKYAVILILLLVVVGTVGGTLLANILSLFGG